MIKKYISLAFVLLSLVNVSAAQEKPADSQAKLISAPEFAISAEDEAAGISGTMKIAVEIDKTGKVTSAGAYVGPSWPCSVNLDRRIEAVLRNAEKAVKEYKFSPAIKNGEPVESRIGISIKLGKSIKEPDPPPSGVDPSLPRSLTGGVVNGKAISLPIPAYPAEAKSARAGGSVSVQVLIGEDGKVISAQAIQGAPVFMFASRAAACGAKFSRTLIEGNPVKVFGVIVYNFVP